MDTISTVNDALLGAFRDADQLERLVRFGLNENLHEIAEGRDLAAIVFRLTDWAESQGLLTELVDAAKSERPHNAKIQALDIRAEQRAARQHYRSKVTGNVGNWELLEYRLSELQRKVEENQRVSKENQRKIDQLYIAYDRGPDLLKTPKSRRLFAAIFILLILIFGIIVFETIVHPYLITPDPAASSLSINYVFAVFAVPPRVVY